MPILLRIILVNQVLALLITGGLALLLGLSRLPFLWIPAFVFTNCVGSTVGLFFALLDRSESHRNAGPVRRNLTRACVVLAGTSLGMTIAIPLLLLLHPGARLPIREALSLSGFALLIAAVMSALHFLYARLKASIEQKAIEIQKLRELEAQTRLMALQTKVNPHFLFNTLNTMLNLVHKSPREVETLILNLSDLYRRILQLPENGLISLSEEMELVQRYLEIEQIRLGNRLSFAVEMDPEAASLRIPPLVIEPLVENAIKHGIAPKTDGGHIRVDVRNIEGAVRIVVEDDGTGMGTQNGSCGFGLYSIRERLRIHYQGRASLEIRPGLGQGFLVELKVPHA